VKLPFPLLGEDGYAEDSQGLSHHLIGVERDAHEAVATGPSESNTHLHALRVVVEIIVTVADETSLRRYY